MDLITVERIALAGSGKSTVARAVAAELSRTGT